MRSSPMDIGQKSVLSKVTQKGMYIRVYTKCSVRFTQLRMVRFRFHCIRNNNWLTYLHKYSTAACMQSMRSAKCVQHCTTTINRFDVHKTDQHSVSRKQILRNNTTCFYLTFVRLLPAAWWECDKNRRMLVREWK